MVKKENLFTKHTWFFLTLVTAIPYLIFANLRVLRMAGDEKVYLSQAIEMIRNNRWFVQTLADEPSYFKGPIHYILIRFGHAIFGDNLISGVWMNALFATLCALCMYAIGKKLFDKNTGLLLGLMSGLNVGIFSHGLVSQMEVELCFFYAAAAAALVFECEFLFWILAGISGWIKSPIHPALLGSGAVLFWAVRGELLSKLKNWRSWIYLVSGILICIAGYLPVMILDFNNFYETYIIRENIGKQNTGRPWNYVLTPLLHFSLPWTLIFFVSLPLFFKNFKSSIKNNLGTQVSLFLALPTILFWCTWGYKGQNYNLPALCLLFLFAISQFKSVKSIPRYSFKIVGIAGLLMLIGAATLIFHFSPLPEWWNPLWIVASFLSLILFSAFFIFCSDVKWLAVGSMLFFTAFGSFITPLGEREVKDLKAFSELHPNETVYYHDLEPSIWSEWSILQLTLHRPIYGLHRVEQVQKVMKPGFVILVQNDANLEQIKSYAKEFRIEDRLEITPWRRWLTKGKSPDGQSRFVSAWNAKDLTLLEKTFYIVLIK